MSCVCCKFYFTISDILPRPTTAELAQSVERTTLNRVVVGSIPTFGDSILADEKELLDFV